jgi:hypothetical protein
MNPTVSLNLTQDTFIYYYNPVEDRFGNKYDWYDKDDWERVVVDKKSAQEIDIDFNNHYGDKVYPILK